MDLACMN